MIEPLFFKCYYAFLKRDIKETKMFYEMLRGELKKSTDKKILHPDYLVELKKIRDSLRTGSFIESSFVDKSTPASSIKASGKRFGGNQDGLVRKVHFEALEDLRSLLGADDDFHLHNIEHPCGEYGAVDMLYRDSNTCYPLEVKKDEGRHDIIGQISKYDLSSKLHLHLKFYRRVVPVTICSSYQNNVVKELKSRGVQVIKYRLDEGKVNLNLI